MPSDAPNGVQAAVEEYLAAQGFRAESMLGDWLLIGANVFVDAEGDPDCEYFTIVSGGSMLQHQALGLIAKAREQVVAPDED
jgi:hypothetical protein